MKINPSSIISYEDLRESIINDNIFPLYFFYGAEDFLIEEIINLLIEKILDPSIRSFNLDIIDGGEANYIINLVSAFPLSSEKRIVVIKDIDKVPDRDRLIPVIENPVQSTVLIICAEKRDMRMSIFKIIQKNAVVVEFKQLFESKITQWIKDRIQEKGKKISLEASEILQSYIGRSLREISNEIDKLLLYVGERPSIGPDDVNEVVGMTKEFNIFELQKAVGKKDLQNSLVILYQLMTAGKSAIEIVSKLARYFINIWTFQELQTQRSSDEKISELLKVKSFTLKEYRIASQHYSENDLKHCFKAMLEADVALKSGKSPDNVLPLLIMTMIRGDNIIIDSE